MGFENVSDTQVTVNKEAKKALVKILSKKINDCDKQNVFNNFDKLTALDLSNCTLTNVQLDFIGLEQRITYLSLAHNNLERVPSCFFTSLKMLEFLDLSHNLIKEFDMEPECINNLKQLKLNNNAFQTIPKWFLNFRAVNLEEFDYSVNKSSHYNYLRKSYNLHIIKLKKLTLRNSSLIDDDFNFLRCFKQLQILDISNENSKHINKFEDIDELFVKSKWKQLEVLKMNNLSLCIFPEGVTWLESLVELYFTDNCISWLPDGIEFMANLEVLDVSNNNLIAIPEKLLKLEFLRIIKAAHNFIEKILDCTLMKNLEVLDLYDNLIEDISANMELLQYVDLEMNYLDSSDLVGEYKEKKGAYRESRKISRLDGSKALPSDYLSSSSEEDETACDHIGEECCLTSVETQEIENWDTPIVPKERNPDIDSEDENWHYEVPTNKPKKVEKIYVEDEDWMFEDVLEES